MTSDPYSLDNLQDIVTGPVVSLWPPAPAWYFVLAVLALQIAMFLLQQSLTFYRNRYRRQALVELAKLERGDTRGLSELLKRVALMAFPRERVASLTGRPWVHFLQETVQGVSFEFEAQSPLASASSEPTPSPVPPNTWEAMVRNASTWIKRHGQGVGT